METTNHTIVKKGRGRPKKNLDSVSHIKSSIMPSVESSPVHPLKKDAPTENYFILCNGQPVKNVKELADLMESLGDDVFNHHVRPGENDFSAWVENVFKDLELAKKISQVKDKKHLQLVVYKHITHKLW